MNDTNTSRGRWRDVERGPQLIEVVFEVLFVIDVEQERRLSSRFDCPRHILCVHLELFAVTPKPTQQHDNATHTTRSTVHKHNTPNTTQVRIVGSSQCYAWTTGFLLNTIYGLNKHN
eukprot:m.122242 g.122242  ORF g.122242 m.122242 type:complete len:117 (+) comp28906_c1_seq7:1019-1369(+)